MSDQTSLNIQNVNFFFIGSQPLNQKTMIILFKNFRFTVLYCSVLSLPKVWGEKMIISGL